MKISALLLPAAAVAGAAVLLAPQAALGFGLNGSILALSQRDFRIFNNFTDTSANDNITPDPNFPGYTGATVALWKGSVEWGSELHGNGSGDPHQPGSLGSGGANFDPSFQGNATAVGGTNDNIHSELAGSSGGTLAFTELPSSNGWRIRYYSNWIWQDGPSTSMPINQIDLQGVACHEYGHALGLNHSELLSTLTMFPTVSGTGVIQRSIEDDDIDGVQARYGVKSGVKPKITAVSVGAANQVTITGLNFSATNNEVWFTQKVAGGTGNPIKVTFATSNGTSIVVTAPPGAGRGDVLVRNNGSGHANLSNAWPIDVGSGSASAPSITAITPSPIDAVSPDPISIVVTGTNFLAVTQVKLDGAVLPPSGYTINSNTQITIPAPLFSHLGDVEIEATNPNGTDTALLSVSECDVPVVDMKDSEPFFLLTAAGMTVTMGSEVGDFAFLYASGSNVPSFLAGIVDFGIGNNFASLVALGVHPIDPVKGWVQFSTGPLTLPPGTQVYVQAGFFPDESGVFLVESSNVQHGGFLF